MKEVTAMLASYLERHPEFGPKAYICTLCNQSTSDKSAGIKHVENIHFAGQLSYKCKYCDEVFSLRNKMPAFLPSNATRQTMTHTKIGLILV